MHGRSFMKMEDLDKICHNFYALLYSRKDICENVMREVFEDFSTTFNEAMNGTLTQEIKERKLGVVVKSMAKGKVLGHDGIPVEFFQQL